MNYWFRYLLFVALLLLMACGGGEEKVLAVPTPVVAAATLAPTAVPPTTAPLPTATLTTQAATPTLAPTATLMPTETAVAVPQTDPPLEAITQLPMLGHGVVFIADGSLKMWGQGTQVLKTLLPGGPSTATRSFQTETVTGDISRFVVSDEAKQLLALKVTDRTDGGNAGISYQYDLLWVDLRSGENRTLATGLHGNVDFALSNDGKHAIYVAQRPASPNSEQYAITLLETGAGSLPRAVADCQLPCGSFAWHPDNQNVVWTDQQGLWLLNLSGKPTQLVANTFAAEPADVLVHAPESWAKNGRFLLIWQGRYEGGNRAVLDVTNSRVLELPDSFVYASPAVVEATWMDDSRLLVMRPDSANPLEGNPSIETWRIPDSGNELVREAAQTLTTLQGFSIGAKHLPDGRFGFALSHPNDSQMSGLYVLKGINDTLTRLTGIPPANAYFETDVQWLPDGTGAVIANQDGHVVLALAAADTLFDLTSLVGQWGHSFHWLPRFGLSTP